MASAQPDVNVQDILARSTSPASLEDLRRKGLKSVLVLNKENVKTLIIQAVEAAIERRSKDRVSDAVRTEAEHGKQEVERMIQEHEKTLANQELLVADRTRLEQELAGMRGTLADKVRTLEAEKQKLVEASKAELDRLLASSREDASKLPELKASLERKAEEVQGLRDRLAEASSERARLEGDLKQATDNSRAEREEMQALRERLTAAEQARDGHLKALDDARAQMASFEQTIRQIEQRPSLDPAAMEGLLNRFKAGLTLELAQTMGTGGPKLTERVEKVASSVAASHVQRAFDEPLESNLGSVTPEARPSSAGERLARIRQRLADSRSQPPDKA